jgi:hypothetical protein
MTAIGVSAANFKQPVLPATPSRFRDTYAPGGCEDEPSREEGAGNAGRSARPQPRMQNKKHTSVVTTGPPNRSGTPCAIGFNGCFVLSPVIGFLATVGVMRSIIAGYQRRDIRTTRLHRPRPITRQLMRPRPSHPARNVRDDRDTPLSQAQDARSSAADLPDVTTGKAAAQWHDGQITRHACTRCQHTFGGVSSRLRRFCDASTVSSF